MRAKMSPTSDKNRYQNKDEVKRKNRDPWQAQPPPPGPRQGVNPRPTWPWPSRLRDLGLVTRAKYLDLTRPGPEARRILLVASLEREAERKLLVCDLCLQLALNERRTSYHSL